MNTNDRLSSAAFASSANSSAQEQGPDLFQLSSCVSEQGIFLPCSHALLVRTWPPLRYELHSLGKFGKGHPLKDYFRSLNSFIQCALNWWSFNKVELYYGGVTMEWWNSHMPENLMCPAMSGMALQMLSHLQKAIITEASHPACFQKKKKKRTEITVKLKRLRYI